MDGSPYPLDALPVRVSLKIREQPHDKVVTDTASESYMDMRQRGQHLVTVTHSGWFNAALDTILNVPVYRRGTFGMIYSSISHLEYRRSSSPEGWVIWYLGRIDHLNGDHSDSS